MTEDNVKLSTRDTINNGFAEQSLSKPLSWLPSHFSSNDPWNDAIAFML